MIDFALVPAALERSSSTRRSRAAGRAALAIDCDLIEERFADTFAKWALNGAVSAVGAGYGIAMPASLEDWGTPLGAGSRYQLPPSLSRRRRDHRAVRGPRSSACAPSASTAASPAPAAARCSISASSPARRARAATSSSSSASQ